MLAGEVEIFTGIAQDLDSGKKQAETTVCLCCRLHFCKVNLLTFFVFIKFFQTQVDITSKLTDQLPLFAF